MTTAAIVTTIIMSLVFIVGLVFCFTKSEKAVSGKTKPHSIKPKQAKNRSPLSGEGGFVLSFKT